MPIAAVPKYLGDKFIEASPGQRFGMLLPIWTSRTDQENDVRQRAQRGSREGIEAAELLARGMDGAIATLSQRERNKVAGLWTKNDNGSKQAWDAICALTKSDQERMHAVAQRQHTLAGGYPPSQCLSLLAKSVAPFTTGLGNEHPLENGFAFITPYGLPYLPGSGIKGVLRRAAEELAGEYWGSGEWRADPHRKVRGTSDQHSMCVSDIDVLFGSQSEDGKDHLQGVFSFWDVLPEIAGNKLMVDIMTPHQGHYYQQKDEAGSTSPHDSGKPIPISFLTVPPDSSFAFHVICDTNRLQRLAPELAASELWKTMLTHAFEHAFAWLGFGAKTSVGYGSMQRDSKAEEKAIKAQELAQAAADKAQRQAQMTPQRLQIEAFVDACRSRLERMGASGKKDKPNTELHAKARLLSQAALEEAGWSAEDQLVAAESLAEWLPQVVSVDMKDERKKLKLAKLRGDA